MSNALAIAAVTATLRALLERSIQPEGSGILVSTQPLDKANETHKTRKGLNLFLYQSAINAGWSNQPMPRQVQPGESGFPPLSLNLYYLVTAYSDDEDTTQDHRLLGRAMLGLHDHPVFSRDEIKVALADSELQDQIERVHITHQPLSLDEMSKMWTSFQTQYRPSAAYQVTVVLIESERASRAPLPVLTRGPGDRGVTSQADLTPPFPTLTELVYLNQQTGAHLDEPLTLNGFHLDQGTLILKFAHPRLDTPLEVPPPPLVNRLESTITLMLPDPGVDPSLLTQWPAGLYTLSANIQQGPDERTTNELPFQLAPAITSILPLTVARDGSGNATINLTCAPQVWPGQRVALLLGDRQIRAQTFSAKTNNLTFVVLQAKPGEYFVRLRVDGVESQLIDRSVTPPVFIATQKVTIT